MPDLYQYLEAYRQGPEAVAALMGPPAPPRPRAVTPAAKITPLQQPPRQGGLGL
jgi:hypothetical protein